MRRLLVPLLLLAFLVSARADDPKSAPPPPHPPPGRREPPPTLGGPPPDMESLHVDPLAYPPRLDSDGRPIDPIEDFGWDDWQLWWEHNLGPYEALKQGIYRREMFPPGAQVPRDPDRLRLGRRTRELVARDVLPALVGLLEGDASRHVWLGTRLDALLSLAKLAREESHVRLLLRWTHRPKVRSAGARTRALLALGVLRRAHPDDQFSAQLLDECRTVLLAWLTDGTGTRDMQRASAIALGLLGDQPTENAALGHQRHVGLLFTWLEHSIEDGSVAPAVLLAIGHQQPANVSAAQRKTLRTLAWKRAIGSTRAAREVVAWAAWALGRVGTAEDIATLRRLFAYPRKTERTQRWCAALGLGALGRRLSGEGRATAGKALRDALMRSREAGLRGYLLIGLGQTLGAAVEAGEHDTYEAWTATAPLLEALRTDPGASRGYAALALGHLAGAIAEAPRRDRADRVRTKMVDALLRALEDERHPRTQAAAAIALGLARASTAREALRALLTDQVVDPRLPPAAAWGIGLLRHVSRKTAHRLRDASRTVMYGRLRQRSIRALALLGNPQVSRGNRDTVDVLLHELQTSKTVGERWEAITLLGRVGDERAIGPLLGVLESKARTGWEQRAAVLALGCIGDLEEETALDRLRRDLHYRSPFVFEFTRLP